MVAYVVHTAKTIPAEATNTIGGAHIVVLNKYTALSLNMRGALPLYHSISYIIITNANKSHYFSRESPASQVNHPYLA